MRNETILIEDQEIIINITSYYGGCSPKIDALPEDCYPAEAAEVEWEIAEEQENKEFIDRMIEEVPKLHNEMTELIFEEINKSSEPQEP